MKIAKVQQIPVEKLKPAEYNPRQNLVPSDADYQKLVKAIGKFGLVEPLVWNKRSGNLVGGHQRLKVLMAETFPDRLKVLEGDRWLQEIGDILAQIADKVVKSFKVPCTVVDLKPADEKALNAALNKISGEWDYEKLAAVFRELDQDGYELDLTGFDDYEIEPLMAADWTPPGVDDLEDEDDDDDGGPDADDGSLLLNIPPEHVETVMHAADKVQEDMDEPLTTDEAVVEICRRFLGS